MNFQRCESVLHPCQVGEKLQLALHLLLQMILQLSHLPSSLPPLVSNPSCLLTGCLPLYARCRTVLLNFSKHCTLRSKIFVLCVCFLRIIFEKSIINLLHYSTIYQTVLVEYLGFNLGTISLDLWTNLTTNAPWEQISFLCRGLGVFTFIKHNLRRWKVLTTEYTTGLRNQSL